jgi:hypothetical protein
VDVDLVEHQLLVSSSDGRRASFPLARRPACADFYSDFFGAPAKVDVDVDIHPEPFDLGDSPALHADLRQRRL